MKEEFSSVLYYIQLEDYGLSWAKKSMLSVNLGMLQLKLAIF